MRAENISEKHYLLSLGNNVETICKPLQQQGITYFCHLRIFNDHTIYGLTNNAESLYNHFKKQFPFDRPRPPKISGDKFHYLPFLDTNDFSYQQLREYRDMFKTDNPIFFFERYKNYTDIYVYASDPYDYNVVNFYINNIDFLEKFKFYFKDKASSLIKKSNKNKLTIAPYLWSNFDAKKNKHVTADNKQRLNKQLKAKHYALSIEGKEIRITQRELDVLQALFYSNTIKEAAQLVELSPRTVESYLNNIRYKLNLRRKSDIIRVLVDAKLF